VCVPSEDGIGPGAVRARMLLLEPAIIGPSSCRDRCPQAQTTLLCLSKLEGGLWFRLDAPCGSAAFTRRFHSSMQAQRTSPRMTPRRQMK